MVYILTKERFWAKVDKSGGPNACWPWKGSVSPGGYGRSVKNKRHTTAHRVAYENAIAPIPSGMFVCHKCDNPPCCNPSHLFIGTHKDNMADRRMKGRYSRGNNHHASVLKENDVFKIRERLDQGLSASSIARDFGVHLSTICRIRDGKTWAILKAEEVGNNQQTGGA